MARPTKPLISRSAAVAAALEIIDSEGLEALSLPRLAAQLNVRAPSLYYHFRDKAAILEAVARAIIAEIPVPRKPPPSRWPEWFVQMSLNFRTVVLRHRNAAPLLLQYRPRLILGGYEEAAAFLSESGVPVHLHVLILDGMETLTLGATITEAMRPAPALKTIFPSISPYRQPHLAAAVAANSLTPRRLFVEMIRGFLRGVLEADTAPAPTAPAPTAPADVAPAGERASA